MLPTTIMFEPIRTAIINENKLLLQWGCMIWEFVHEMWCGKIRIRASYFTISYRQDCCLWQMELTDVRSTKSVDVCRKTYTVIYSYRCYKITVITWELTPADGLFSKTSRVVSEGRRHISCWCWLVQHCACSPMTSCPVWRWHRAVVASRR